MPQKLLLCSSTKFLIENNSAFGRPLKDYRIAYITTASKGVQDHAYLQRAKKIFSDLELNYAEMDLDGQNEESLRQSLQAFDAIYMQGGSTVYLLNSIRQSGFEKVLRELLAEGTVYIGASAGSYVCCPTIEMAFWKEKHRHEKYMLSDFTGMNLVPFLLSVHYAAEQRDLLQAEIEKTDYPVKILTDAQAIAVEGDKYTLIGAGPEIKL